MRMLEIFLLTLALVASQLVRGDELEAGGTILEAGCGRSDNVVLSLYRSGTKITTTAMDRASAGRFHEIIIGNWF